MIYKYYPPNCFSLDALKNEYFWCSKRKYLNDPFDTHGEIINRFPKFKDELRKLPVQVDAYPTIYDEFGICCFSKERLNMHLWAFYAESFKGWTLEFKDEEFDCVAQLNGYPITYKDVLYLTKWTNLDDLDKPVRIGGSLESIRVKIKEAKKLDQIFEYLLLTKDKTTWKKEAEKRIILGRVYAEDHLEKESCGYKLNWSPRILKSIIIGHNISIRNLEKIKQIARCKNIPLYMTHTVNSGLGFELDIKEVDLT
jgi:hypothetical protein